MEKKKVQVVIFAKEDEKISLLLLQTKADRAEHWQNVTGSVDPGEDFLRAAKRELLEETGIDSEVQLVDLEFRFHDRWKKDVVEKVFFTLLDKKPSTITLCEQEHQKYQWISIDEVQHEHFGYPSNFQAFQKARELI